ncbi:receptor-like protein 43 [Rhododendron vialii]|uniref:receptor-like protein 43 n=1 Tax=Rhododendron vialii TaxID=182163 RepID=UPI00265F0DFB|nr:receptor-like protein 43 [Rhododendron vialii]
MTNNIYGLHLNDIPAPKRTTMSILACEMHIFFRSYLSVYAKLQIHRCTQNFKFSFDEYSSWVCDASSPNMESWKKGFDCYLWDGVDCDNKTGQELDIGFNDALTGYLPDFMNLSYPLQFLDLSFSGFFGEWPDLVANLKSLKSSLLEIIDLSNNNLYGTVPNSTFELPNLTHLILSSNSFSGTILESNRFRENLIVLDLQMNNFSSTIHDSITKRNILTTINLNGNGFEGPILKSLVNCRKLEVLSLRRNKFVGKFPHWTTIPFPLLRVLDMSNNIFSGTLPKKYFTKFEAMMNVDDVDFRLNYMINTGAFHRDYYDSLTMVIKGSTMEMEKILTIFSAVDLSRNKFGGEIPEVIGAVNLIRGLNLSHNSLTGYIPKSLGNLTELEWLDLSPNKLIRVIPQQLTNLNFLGTLNLSQNRLTGPIPRGKQFDAFPNDSYINNSALGGPPLSNTFGIPRQQPPPLTFEEEYSESVSVFCWEVILPGYGSGLVIGLVVGYLMFSFGKPQWLVKMVEDVGNRNGKRLKRNARRHGGRWN